ncbi:hypothetical protein [Pedobacter steynii]|uniref:YD repeat-containing protein n=1 Tax=Pedobacter steynii TaxID=430522 RepID=A0A1D7QEU9_9SPHI|nr:hypothetical protein [Pedobacter steynii]AOM77211.1 hypothetical protein BFS30_08595 [Pedobacter steynii]
MKRTYFFLMVFIAYTSCCLGQTSQTNKDLKNVITPSPNASALGQYGNTEIGLYTGIPSINIPLYEVKEKDISVPIGLNYNAGGIKVTEYASSSGLGWTLSAGGVINRSMYGRPDELRNFSVPVPTQPTPQELLSIARDDIDYQPDVFYFNFMGKSGRFYLGLNDKITIVPYQKLKIALFRPIGSSNIIGFKVTTEDGTIYEFNDYETTKSRGYQLSGETDPDVPGPGTAPASINSWYLSKITSTNGAVVTLTYESYSLQYDMPSSDQRYVILNPQQASVYPPNILDENVRNISRSFTENKRLKLISFSNGQVEFSYDKDRRDLIGDKMLTGVRIKSTAGLLRKEYKLNHKYMANGLLVDLNAVESGLEDNFLNGANYLTKNRRLILDQVQELGATGSISKTYGLTYETGLPARDSRSRDHWGYYNNYTFNQQYYLDYELSGPPNIFANYIIKGKGPLLSACKAGTLKKITYPTGGSTEFDYELNRVADSGIIPPTEVPQSHSMNIDYSNYSTLLYSSYIEGGVKRYYKDFNITKEGTANVNIQITGYQYQEINRNSMSFEIYNASNTVVVSMFDIDGNGQKTVNPVNGTVAYNYTVALPSGDYRLVFKPIATFIDNNTYYNTFHEMPAAIVSGWSNILPAQPGPGFRDVGGLRVKSVKDFDPISNQYTQKNYEYLLPDGKTSGELVSNVTHTYGYAERKRFVHDDIEGIVDYVYAVLNSDTNYPLSTTQGSYVGYSTVTVTSVDPVSQVTNGKSIFKYTSPSSYPDYFGALTGPVNAFPYPPADSRDWQRGLLLEQTDFGFANNSFYPVKKVNNDYYPTVFMDNVAGLTVKYVLRVFANAGFELTENLYQYSVYNFKSGYQPLKTTVEKNFFNNDSTSVMTSYNYTSAPVHLFPTEITTTGSNEELLTKIKYAADFANVTASDALSAGIKNLGQKNILSAEIEKSVFRKSGTSTLNLVSSDFTGYKPSQTLPDTVYTIENVAPLSNFAPALIQSGAVKKDPRYVPVISMIRYDLKGNLLQQKKINGISHSYLWSYNGSFPIAEIKNADYSAIETALGAPAILTFTNSTPSQTQIGTFLNPLKTALPNAEITQYSYDPLAGLTSSTDAKGMVTYYEYDTFMRLKTIKDHNGHIIKNYQYYYKP